MSELRVRVALDALVPPAAADSDGIAWPEVRRRAARLRRRRRRVAVSLASAMTAAAFGVLAASGQIGGLVSHSKAPHLVVRATLSTGTFQVEIERAVVALDSGVRVVGWRTPSGDAFSARWFLDVRGDSRVTASVRPIGTLCTACPSHASGKLTLTRAQVATLVRGKASVTVTFASGRMRGSLALDRSSLRRGVMCLRPGEPCARIYTGRP
jgi:hypothetical protein